MSFRRACMAPCPVGVSAPSFRRGVSLVPVLRATVVTVPSLLCVAPGRAVPGRSMRAGFRERGTMG